MVCENSTGLDKWYELILWYHPIIQIIFTFILAFVLSTISLGFFFFIVIYIISELYFGWLIGFKYDNSVVIVRFSIFLAGLFGFTLGRIYLIQDDNPYRHSFHEWL